MFLKGNRMYVLASFIAAFAIGYTIQNSDENTIFSTSAEDSSPELVDPLTVQHTSAPAGKQVVLPFAPSATLADVQPHGAFVAPSTRMKDSLEPNPIADSKTYSAYGVPCSMQLTTTASAAAMISIKLSASCEPNQHFVLQQGDLKVSGKTSVVGLAKIKMPALSDTATITVHFDDGQTASSEVEVADFNDYDRVALQWKGRSGLAIHALEFGADYGQAGHVWKETPRTIEHAESAFGGFMTRLDLVDSADALHAEIYSFPSATAHRDGAIRLSVEAEITEFNCGTKVSAQTLQSKALTGVEVVDLMLLMPDCDAVGDFLVLNNLLRDLKIALN